MMQTLREEIEFQLESRFRLALAVWHEHQHLDEQAFPEGTLLHLAAYHGDGAMLELLLMLGADPLVRNRRHHKPSDICPAKYKPRMREAELIRKALLDHERLLVCDVDGALPAIVAQLTEAGVAQRCANLDKDRFLELLGDVFDQICKRVFDDGQVGVLRRRPKTRLSAMGDIEFGELVGLAMQELRLREEIAIFLGKNADHFEE